MAQAAHRAHRAIPECRLAALRVHGAAREVDAHVGLTADDPGIVPRWDLDRIARPDVDLLAVVHAHVQPARDAVTEVVDLAAVAA